MTEGTYSSLEIDASPDAIYAVAADVAAYPDWANGVKSVEVLESDDTGLVKSAKFVVDVFVKEIEYVLHYKHDRPNVMSWSADEGDDLRMLEGSYQFAEKDDGTEVIYTLTVEPKFTIPGFIKRQGEKQLVTTALRGLKKRVAAGG